MEGFRYLANGLAELLGIAFEVISAATILVGLVSAFRTTSDGVRGVQLRFASYLVLALEFLLAADILSTLRAPTWADIARLAAVATIRTGLDYYLSREIERDARRDSRRPAD